MPICTASSFYTIFVKLLFHLRKVTYLFVSVVLIYPSILERDNFIENVYAVLSCLIKKCSFLTLFVSILIPRDFS